MRVTNRIQGSLENPNHADRSQRTSCSNLFTESVQQFQQRALQLQSPLPPCPQSVSMSLPWWDVARTPLQAGVRNRRQSQLDLLLLMQRSSVSTPNSLSALICPKGEPPRPFRSSGLLAVPPGKLTINVNPQSFPSTASQHASSQPAF